MAHAISAFLHCFEAKRTTTPHPVNPQSLGIDALRRGVVAARLRNDARRKALRGQHGAGLAHFDGDLGAHGAAQGDGLFALHPVDHLGAVFALGQDTRAVEQVEVL